MVLLTAQAGSLLANLVDEDIVLAYASGHSTLLRTMRRLEKPRVVPVDSLDEMEMAVGDAPEVRIGVIIPPEAEFDLEAGNPVQLNVVRAHWAEIGEVNSLIEQLDQGLSAETPSEIEFTILPELAYPQPEGGGRSLMVTSALVIGVLSIGTFLTPYLLAEEREEGTLSVLMLSPASGAQITFAKALVGLTYCLIVGFVALLFNLHFIVHPWVSSLAIFMLGFFAVCLGLLIGLLAEQISTVNLWMAVALLILILPTIVLFMDSSSLPAWVGTLLDWIPTVAAGRLLRLSFAEAISARILLQPISALAVFAIGSFSAVVYKLRQEDRA
jgi:ABC-type transport system involved in multi-copper enzyme maturation permease subunit